MLVNKGSISSPLFHGLETAAQNVIHGKLALEINTYINTYTCKPRPEMLSRKRQMDIPMPFFPAGLKACLL